MAKKELTRIAKLEFMAGQAKPGPALAGLGIDMGGFTKEYNDATRDMGGSIIPVEIKCYSDRSYEFVLKTTPASRMILKAAKIQKGAVNAFTDQVGKLTKAQVQEIAEYKMKDLNANDLENAMAIIVGTAHNMGIEVEGYKKKERDESQQKLIINENYEQQIAEMEAGIAEANAEAAAKKAEESDDAVDKNEDVKADDSKTDDSKSDDSKSNDKDDKGDTK